MAGEKPSILSKGLHPDNSKSETAGGYVSAESGPIGKRGYIETPVKAADDLPQPADDVPDAEIEELVTAEEETQPEGEDGTPPWAEAALKLIDEAKLPGVPTRENAFLSWLAENTTAAGWLQAHYPLLAEKLGLETALPVELFRVAHGKVEASPALGRQLLDTNLDIETMVAMVPSKAALIRKSIDLWQTDAEKRMREKLEALRLTNAENEVRDKARIAAVGAPAPAARQLERQAAERKILKAARAAGQL